jgi:hypothetical protein
MGSLNYPNKTPLTRLLEKIPAVEDLSNIQITDKDLSDDFALRYDYLKKDGALHMTIKVSWQAEQFSLTTEALQSAMQTHPTKLVDEILRWTRKSAVQAQQLVILPKIAEAINKQGIQLLQDEIDAWKNKLEHREDELTVLEAQNTAMETAINTAENLKNTWFDRHNEIKAKYDALYQQVSNNPDRNRETSVFSERSEGGSKKKSKLPHPDKFTDGKMPTWKHWRPEMERKIASEDFDEYGAASYVMSRVEGDTMDALLLLSKALGKEEKEVTSEEMFECLQERYGDPFEKANAKKAFKDLSMKPYADFHEFKNEFLNKAIAAGIKKEDWKEEMFERFYFKLKEGTALQGSNPKYDFKELCDTAATLSRTYKTVNDERQIQQKKKEDAKKRTGNSTSALSNNTPSTNSSDNNKEGGRTGLPRKNNNFGSFRSYNLNKDQALQLTKERKCFKCKKEGHFATNCTETAITELTPETGALVVSEQPKNE